MRSKIKEQIAYKGDCTVAVQKYGCGVGVFIVHGANGAIVSTCDTSNGVFTKFAEVEDGMNIVDLTGAKEYVKVEDAEYAELILGDCPIDPQTVSGTITNPPKTFYAYEYEDTEDKFLVYLKEEVTEAGTYDLFNPEIGTEYAYQIAKGSIKIESVSEEGVITDDDNVEYTPVAEENITL